MLRIHTTFALFILSALPACGSEPPAAPDSGIFFVPPDSAVRLDATADADAAQPPPEGPSCTVDSDCPEESPVCVTDDAIRDGYCTEFCPLDGTDVCPAGAHCTQRAFMTGLCLVECDPELEHPCRVGFGCGERALEAAVCVPGCDLDSDCPEGLRCNRTDGILGEGQCYDPTAALTDPCTEPEDCNSDSWCIRERDRGWPGGACTVFRCNEVENTGCPGDAQCVFDFYRDSICVDGCETDADCRPGYACEPDETYPDRIRCTPRCQADAECVEPGFRCDLGTGRCEL